VAIIVGNKVHIVKAGSVTIYADQPGDNVSFGPAAEQSQVLTITTLTGIDAFPPTKYVIYPNPANDLLFITNETMIIQKIEIINMVGKVVISQIYNLTNVTVNTGGLAEGIYLIKVYNKRGDVAVNKILKQ